MLPMAESKKSNILTDIWRPHPSQMAKSVFQKSTTGIRYGKYLTIRKTIQDNELST
jgi:hypothetical protein